MKCPKCQIENPEDSRFCSNCATPLQPSKDSDFTQAETIQTPKEELTTGTTFAGRYQIIEEIGKGGMGKVYKVLDKEINTNVALKLIMPEIAADEKTIERFRNELKTAREITHKNVCRMHDLNKEEGSYYITMEYVSGEDLRRLTRKAGQLSAGRAISIAKQICEGMSEAHRLGVVHRDLKPQNIMVDEEGNACIMDFGIARSIKAKEITDKGIIIGTPEYMSPEQVEGKGIDHRSDIYSLGIILYEMVTGRVPFEGDTPLSVAMKHKSEVPKDPMELNPQIPEDLSKLILKCMEKKRGERYQSAEELLLELKNVEEKLPTTEKVIAKRKPLTSKEITVTFRKRWLVVGVVAAAAIIALLSILYFMSKGPAIPPEPESARKMLVVLPFKNLGPSEDEYFADGITEEIMSRLGSIPELGVIARSSVIQYKQTDKPIQQIGKELGVEFILEGTVRWQHPSEEQSKVRVTPQLIRVSDATQIWSDRYDAILADIFQVQSDIAQQVTQALDITLAEPERRVLEAKPTDNLEAYDYYLRGNDYYKAKWEEKEIRIAIQLFEKAVELDPNFALAYAQLSRAQADLYWFYCDRTEKQLIKAKEAVDKALHLNPDLPEAHLALGWYYYHGKLDYDRALAQFAIVQKSQPNNSDLLHAIGLVQRRQGRFEEAVTNLKKASKLDPRSGTLTTEVGLTYTAMRKFSEAEDCYNRAIALAPDNSLLYALKAELYLGWQGDIAKARAVLEEASQKVGLIDSPEYILRSTSVKILDHDYQEALNKLSLIPSEGPTLLIILKKLRYAQIYGLMNQSQIEKAHFDSARNYLEGEIKKYPENALFHELLGVVYAGLGWKKEAIREGKLGVELLPVSKDAFSGPDKLLTLAQIYAMVGEFDSAIDQLEHLLSIPGDISIPLLRIDPKWDPLREHSRFQKLLQQENTRQ